MQPVLIRWGGLTIGSYAALLDLGLVAAVAVVWLEARRLNLRPAVWLDTLLAVDVIGVVLALLGFAAIQLALFHAAPAGLHADLPRRME